MFTDGVVLIDADSIYFRTACVTKKKNDIRKSIDMTMDNIRRECMSDTLMVAVKGRDNFRNDIYPLYKKNRKELAPDLKEALTYGHDYMKDKYNAIQADNMEADDLVSIWAREARDSERDYVVVGIDKDLLQIPGDHYNFVKRAHLHMDRDNAYKHLMLQCLTGDGTDNIPGIRGIGPKKAGNLLSGVQRLRQWSRVRAAWRANKAGDPYLSRSLLQMLTSFEEADVLRSYYKDKTPECKPYVGSEG